ncbi:DUF2380 domain-containing protein [Corallococcus interemptor]|uniref:DUF2380 domain-containing protein n=1 Tax=Corallococcus interemptor TaxID=2316720 RepID=A0A3A8QXB2_9BACT|nr:DUF2380 domain-containing protein [Corallococcus interemptor]
MASTNARRTRGIRSWGANGKTAPGVADLKPRCPRGRLRDARETGSIHSPATQQRGRPYALGAWTACGGGLRVGPPEEWARRPKERHHIFPQAFEKRFARRGIDVHQWVIAIDAELHHKIHRGEAGGPWNQEWEEWLQLKRDRARQVEYFEQASAMIQKYGLFGLTMTYWQTVDLSPQPVRED